MTEQTAIELAQDEPMMIAVEIKGELTRMAITDEQLLFSQLLNVLSQKCALWGRAKESKHGAVFSLHEPGAKTPEDLQEEISNIQKELVRRYNEK